jgi:hypothetical protein
LPGRHRSASCQFITKGMYDLETSNGMSRVAPGRTAHRPCGTRSTGPQQRRVRRSTGGASSGQVVS